MLIIYAACDFSWSSSQSATCYYQSNHTNAETSR